MSEDQVVSLMNSATSEKDWNNKADQVKRSCGGYPDFWYRAVIMSGVLVRANLRWQNG
jgi:hypothetical protein